MTKKKIKVALKFQKERDTYPSHSKGGTFKIKFGLEKSLMILFL